MSEPYKEGYMLCLQQRNEAIQRAETAESALARAEQALAQSQRFAALWKQAAKKRNEMWSEAIDKGCADRDFWMAQAGGGVIVPTLAAATPAEGAPMADHPFQGWSSHEGLGPCHEPRDWCHEDCGLPPEQHPPYSPPPPGGHHDARE